MKNYILHSTHTQDKQSKASKENNKRSKCPQQSTRIKQKKEQNHDYRRCTPLVLVLPCTATANLLAARRHDDRQKVNGDLVSATVSVASQRFRTAMQDGVAASDAGVRAVREEEEDAALEEDGVVRRHAAAQP